MDRAISSQNSQPVHTYLLVAKDKSREHHEMSLTPYPVPEGRLERRLTSSLSGEKAAKATGSDLPKCRVVLLESVDDSAVPFLEEMGF